MNRIAQVIPEGVKCTQTIGQRIRSLLSTDLHVLNQPPRGLRGVANGTGPGSRGVARYPMNAFLPPRRRQ